MAGKTVVVLGAGVGGLVAANRLRRMLDKEHRVVLIDRSPIYTFTPSLTWVMLGERTVPQISRDLRKLEKKGIEFKTADVTGFDFDNKRVLLSIGQVVYDYLVVSLGVDYTAEDVPGLNRAWSFYHPDGAEGLRDALKDFQGGRVAIVVPSLPYRCPPAPYEGALMLEHHFRKRQLRAGVQLKVITPEPQPLVAAGSAVGERLLALLRDRDVAFSGGRTAKSINHEKRLVNFTEGDPEEFDLLIATPVHRLPAVVAGTPLVNGGAWIPVDRETMQTAVPDVYAIGDATMIQLANGNFLPKAGVFAHGQAEVVARNLAAEIAGKEPIWAYGGQGACFLETGGGRGAYVTGHFYTEPEPDVALRNPGRMWHWAKLGFERIWLWRWF